MKTYKGMLKYRDYFAFCVMAELHASLFPGDKSIDGGSRRAGKIFKALDKAYTDGFEDAAQLDDAALAKVRRRFSPRDRGV